jgi:hypothetical protein
VTFDAPPRIDSATPPTIPNSGVQQLTIRGANFRDPTVGLACDTGATLTATVTAWDANTIEANVSTGAVNQGVCTVTVTDADGATASWAALSITNPAQNLFPWQVGPSMVEPRRAPAAAAGRTTAVARWIYAIGGDDGDPTHAKRTIEVAPVGVFGELGPFRVLPDALPAPRTLAASAVIGRFVYLVGGNDGTGPVDTVLRAQLLDPLQVPYLTDVSVLPGAGAGLGGGDWVWQVAALYDPTDLSNPGGESLPSERLSLSLLDTPDGLRPTLSWTPVSGAVGYRVYRSATAGDPAPSWVADVLGTTFVDDGAAADPSRVPLGPGALGAWAELPPLPEPRESPCVATAPEPFPDPELRYLYVAGGFDAAADPLDGIAWLDLQLVTEHEQTPGAWTVSANRLSDPRAQCAGFGVDAALHSVVAAGESWVYFGGGTDGGRVYGTVEAGEVLTGGELADWQEIDGMSPGRAGFAYAAASNFLYGFGGQNAAPSKSGVSAELDPDALPDVFNWNSLGTSLSESRYLPGSTQESAVIFVLGGETDTAAASATVDWTNF